MFAVDTPGGRFCFLCAYIISVNLSGLHRCAIRTHDVDVSDSSYKNTKGKEKTRKGDGEAECFCEQGSEIFSSRFIPVVDPPNLHFHTHLASAMQPFQSARKRLERVGRRGAIIFDSL